MLITSSTRGCRRYGLTVLEVVVMLVLIPLLILAMVGLFQWVGDRINQGRAEREARDRIRQAQLQLQRDLDGITAPTTPLDPQAGTGYVELLEGPDRSLNRAAAVRAQRDVDDVLLFTSRSHDVPFQGQMGISLQSHLAEIVWWVDAKTNHLHRRVLLIRPDLNQSKTGKLPFHSSATSVEDLAKFYRQNDLSVRLHAERGLVANSLADLNRREHRFGHDPGTFPHVMPELHPGAIPAASWSPFLVPLGGGRTGEDLILENVKDFDLRVFDPEAELRGSSDMLLLPGDEQYLATQQVIGTGAYVDLNYSRSADSAKPSHFHGPCDVPSGLHQPKWPALYDTWAKPYESPPPYAAPLRGLRINMTLSDQQRTHQATVTAEFVTR